MALTAAQIGEMTARRVQRLTAESTYANTINLADQVAIDFVWYPGARNLNTSLIDVVLPLPTAGAAPREVHYTWARTGMATIARTLASGHVTLPLAPGSHGTLTVFGTEWRITRAAAGVAMSASGTLQGVQQRLNRLGYHLRGPGALNPGIDGTYGARSESAVIAFQVDYDRPTPVPVGAPASPLKVRGEWTNNANIQGNLDSYNGVAAGTAANPSAADGTALQTALVAIVGM